LPVCAGLAVDAARIPFMWLAYETRIHWPNLPEGNTQFI
jgi:hypothetical protein